jgi:hypothetical protein
MKKKFKILNNKIKITLLLLVSAFVNFVSAAGVPVPPAPNQDGEGGGGPGVISPIDMYQIVLFILAVMLICYFFKKIKLAKV